MPPDQFASPLQILPQPSGSSCGPTCLHAVYRFFGDEVPLERLIADVPTLEDGGTLGVLLATHALRRGYAATLYTYNLQVFDPTWFELPGVDLAERLRRQLALRRTKKRLVAIRAYLDFLESGGTIAFEDLTPGLLTRLIGPGLPLLAGVSATFLYRSARERDDQPDDLRGDPVGHFVVIRDHDPETQTVSVADPLHDNPGFHGPYYRVSVHRLLNALLLGILSYDANLVVLRPGERSRE